MVSGVSVAGLRFFISKKTTGYLTALRGQGLRRKQANKQARRSQSEKPAARSRARQK